MSASISAYGEDGNFVISNAFKEVPLNGYGKNAYDINKNADTINGKWSFQGSQTVACCRNVPGQKPFTIHVDIGQARSMMISPDFQQLQNTGIGVVKPNPTFQNAIVPEWHSPEDEVCKATKAKIWHGCCPGSIIQ